MIQALHACSRLLVTGLRVSGVNVVVALAWLAGTTNLVGAPKEARRTFITSTACSNKQARWELPSQLARAQPHKQQDRGKTTKAVNEGHINWLLLKAMGSTW